MLFFTVLLFFAVAIYAQQQTAEKFGKIDAKDFDLKKCPIDPDAQAFYLFDNGDASFQYADSRIYLDGIQGSDKGFQVVFKRHFRIKITDANAGRYADFIIPLYNDGKYEEKLTELRGNTYNLAGSAVNTDKLEKNKVIYEKKTNRITHVKFPMPGVKAGSIIEVSYITTSDFYYNLPQWNFQYDIPVLYSNYTVAVPEYFSYSQYLKGYVPVDYKQTNLFDKITFDYYDRSPSDVQYKKVGSENLQFTKNIATYTAVNVPAFIEEPHLRSANSYTASLLLELQTMQLPKNTPINYTKTWESVAENLLSHPNFGEAMLKTDFLTDAVALLKQQKLTGLDLAAEARRVILKKIQWNGIRRLTTAQTLREAYKNGKGSSSEINLTLIALLKELGFIVFPMALSTQENGMLNPVHPSADSFNYVVAAVEWEGKYYLFDATDPLADMNLLPLRCLNDKGLILNPKALSWINLNTGITTYKEQGIYQISLNPDKLTFEGNMSFTYHDYAAYLMKKQLSEFADTTELKNKLQQTYKGITISEVKIETAEKGAAPLKEQYQFTLSNYTESAGDLIFFSPLFFETKTDNPFTSETRAYPVEFDYPSTLVHTITINIPPDFAIESVPQPFVLTLGNKAAKYLYNITQNGNTLQISNQFNVQQTLFLPEEYPDLRAFYTQVIAKQQEKIVLKRR